MSDPYRTPPAKPVPSFSLLAFLQKWFGPARLVILLCGGVLALLDIVPFGIVAFLSTVELIFQIRLNILNDCKETQSNIFSIVLFILLLIFSWLVKTPPPGTRPDVARMERDRQAKGAEQTSSLYANRLSLCIGSECFDMGKNEDAGLRIRTALVGYNTNDIKDLSISICIHKKCVLVDKDIK